MRQSSIDKTDQVAELSNIRSIFVRSLVFNHDLKCGYILKEEDIGYKKPGYGLPFEKRSLFIGKKLTRNVKVNDILSSKDIEKLVK